MKLFELCETLEKWLRPGIFQAIPRIPNETERFLYIGPSTLGSFQVDMRLMIRTTDQTYGALVEKVEVGPWIFRKDMSNVEEDAHELIELMKFELKKAGLIPNDKKPKPEKLPGWLVSP